MNFPKKRIEDPLTDYQFFDGKEIDRWREALRKELERIISKSKSLAAVQLDSSIVGQAELAREVLERLKQ